METQIRLNRSLQQVEDSVDKRKEILVKHANGKIHAEVLPKEHPIP